MTDQGAWAALDAAMQSLWHLGILAVHDVGSERGDGLRACRKLYDDAGGAESGHLGFCYYRREDAAGVPRGQGLELVCGDFLNKNLVSRKVQELVKKSLQAAGLDAAIARGTNRVVVRSLDARRTDPPPPPLLHVTPEPPAELVAATTAVPARSAAHKRSLLTSRAMPTSPLDKLQRMALGLGAPPPIPDAPGLATPETEASTPGSPRPRRRHPPRLTRGARRAIGISLTLTGLVLGVLLWDTSQHWIGAGVVLLIGLVFLVLGRKEKRPPRSERD